MNAPVSVVIPTYNRAYCLERTIDSALAQTHQPVEVLVVDDGSTDGTPDLLSGRYGGEERVIVLRQDNRGVAAARNLGLAAARGEYVALLDSDDVWEPWKIELQVACLRHAPGIGMVWTDMKAVGLDGRVFSTAYLKEMYDAYRWWSAGGLFSESVPLADVAPGLRAVVGDRRLFIGDIFSQMIMGSLVHTSTVLLTRERALRVGGFNEALRPSGEDFDFHLRTCREGPVGFVNLATIDYQRGLPDRLTGHGYRVHLARNFLRTIAPVIAQDRDRIQLPEHMLKTVLAEAHQWLGEVLLDEGAPDEARGHLLRSLRHRPWQPRTLGLLGLATLPPALQTSVRRAYRAIRGGPS